MRYDAAIKAKSAKARATIAINMLKTYKTLGRSFDNCFEMYDGAEVKAEIIKRLNSTTWKPGKYILRERIKRIFNWPEIA